MLLNGCFQVENGIKRVGKAPFSIAGRHHITADAAYFSLCLALLFLPPFSVLFALVSFGFLSSVTPAWPRPLLLSVLSPSLLLGKRGPKRLPPNPSRLSSYFFGPRSPYAQECKREKIKNGRRGEAKCQYKKKRRRRRKQKEDSKEISTRASPPSYNKPFFLFLFLSVMPLRDKWVASCLPQEEEEEEEGRKEQHMRMAEDLVMFPSPIPPSL